MVSVIPRCGDVEILMGGMLVGRMYAKVRNRKVR